MTTRLDFPFHVTTHFFKHAPRILLLSCVLTACSKEPAGAPGGGMFGGPAPVAVREVQPENIPLTMEYVAQIVGSREAEVRAQVTGIVLRRNFVEGGPVKAGQSLFTIDPAPFEIALARAQADLASAQARRTQAQREATRLQPLHEVHAVSRKEFDDATSTLAIADAEVLSAQARLDEARVRVGYTRVTAPISGVAGRALKSEGTLVSGPDMLLTTVTQTDPIHILFGIPDQERLDFQRAVAAGQMQWPRDGRFTVTVRAADGREYTQSGVVDFTDVHVNPQTGSREARAVLPNPAGRLHPGEFVRVRLAGAARLKAYQVPQRAVQESPQGRFVYVVDTANKAALRPVTVEEWRSDMWIVTNGLSPGDKVIVDGTMKIGPGAPVQIATDPTPAAVPGAAPAAASAAK